MISVLICSINQKYLSEVSDNISKTIGVPFEILWFDNRGINKGLCEVYNHLAEKAKYDYLCFVHEDVLFDTDKWGEIIIQEFSLKNNLGLIGVAGNKYKSKNYSGWFNGISSFDCVNIVHRFPLQDEKHFLKPTKDSLPEEVVCIDGVFMCCKKSIWQNKRFDDQRIPGFHFYDLDFSLRVAGEYEVIVVYNINLIHITKGGDFGNNWVEASFSFHNNWQQRLPFTKEDMPSEKVEKEIAGNVLDQLKNFKISLSNKFKWIARQKLYSDPFFYYSILKFLLYQPLQLQKLHKLIKQK